MHKCSNTTLRSRVKPFLQNHGFCGNFYLAVLQVLFWGISPNFLELPKNGLHFFCVVPCFNLKPICFRPKIKDLSPHPPKSSHNSKWVIKGTRQWPDRTRYIISKSRPPDQIGAISISSIFTSKSDHIVITGAKLRIYQFLSNHWCVPSSGLQKSLICGLKLKICHL